MRLSTAIGSWQLHTLYIVLSLGPWLSDNSIPQLPKGISAQPQVICEIGLIYRLRSSFLLRGENFWLQLNVSHYLRPRGVAPARYMDGLLCLHLQIQKQNYWTCLGAPKYILLIFIDATCWLRVCKVCRYSHILNAGVLPTHIFMVHKSAGGLWIGVAVWVHMAMVTGPVVVSSIYVCKVGFRKHLLPLLSK